MARVLIVDDDPVSVETCSLALRHEGYEVANAASVSGALSALTSAVPHALLLDWRLPDGTALDILHWLDAQNRRIPAALITGFWLDHSFEAAFSEAKRLGVSACIRRGLDLGAAPNEVIRRVLDPLVALHSDVLRGNESAREVLTHTLLRVLVPRLRARFRAVAPDMVSDAVTDAILEHLRNPTVFDPVRHVSLEGFIWMSARRRLSNAIRTIKRDLARDSEYATLRAVQASRDLTSGMSAQRQIVEDAIGSESDPRVRMAIRAWLDGEQDVTPWLRIAEVAVLSPGQRRREIKRQKDRFIARAKRLKRRAGLK